MRTFYGWQPCLSEHSTNTQYKQLQSSVQPYIHSVTRCRPREVRTILGASIRTQVSIYKNYLIYAYHFYHGKGSRKKSFW